MARLLPLALILGLILTGPAHATPAQQASAELSRLEPIHGEQVVADDLDGRVLMVAFFASWCPPCRAEFPHLNTIQRAYGSAGLSVVAVNVFEDFDGLSTPADLERFLAETAPGFPVVRGDRSTRQRFGNLKFDPTLFVFARDGRLAMVFRHRRGAERTHLSEAELRAAVEPLL